jgi:site-specific DNA-methyltransferase (adenine-specific)
MPTLHWDSKATPEPVPGELAVDSIAFPQGAGYPSSDPDSHLILGDNLAVMSALLPEYQNRIDLIYADPPFFTNRRYPARIGRNEDSRKPKEWLLGEGYPDHWPDIDSYLNMLYPRLALMHRLLSPQGTLYLHLDWHANAYARLLLDEIFGSDRLLNEIIWVYHGPSPIRSAFNRKHDTILVYTKSKDYTFNVDAVRQPYDPNTVKTFGSSPKAGFGKVPDLERGKVPEDWWYFPVVARLHSERTGYPTQKPFALLERIILASSNPGDLVADFFCGSGTTPTAAAQLDRRFLASDNAWRSIHTTRSRLVRLPAPAFSLQRDIHSRPQPLYQTEDQPAARRIGDTIFLNCDPASLDYWEIDPAWDGNVFRSAAQAFRKPRSREPLANQVDFPGLKFPPTQAGSPGRIRLVNIDGEQFETPISPSKV